MLFASDYNDNRVHIDETHSNQEYYCPYCGAPLITKKGDVRQHHFAHKQNHVCSDTWAHSGPSGYDVSPWHNEWQSLFPKENQEVKLVLGDTKHRADVLIDRTVVEFQYSIMPVTAFDNRNNFYFNLGYKVVWLFDLSDLYENGQLTYRSEADCLVFDWKNPKKAFNSYDIQSGCIDLFFQLSDSEDACIVRVRDVSQDGFEQFSTSQFISKDDFLKYVGLKNGVCLPPCRDDLDQNQQYQLFKKRYNINLNKQQERALQAVEGSNLLLAVPGSGKTTVLVARLGYMVLQKNIAPESILAITYNKDAAEEMHVRFSAQFGDALGQRIEFWTINKLANRIYEDHYQRIDQFKRTTVGNKPRRQIIQKVFWEVTGRWATENDFQEVSTAITYIKNMMLTEKEIAQIEDRPHLLRMYQLYEAKLREQCYKDLDDQMVFSLRILRENIDIAQLWRRRYKYICVDEAQDTSKIQHELIRILARGNNLFMVGDEDQSIYGFRAAYPKALLNFRYDYLNPYILRMECNYRSTPQIVSKAQQFISQNKGRYEKKMIADRDSGEDVHLETVPSREAQYLRLLDIAKSAKTETAFLYRDNESSVALVDLFLRNSISFKLRKPEMNFFDTRIVKDIIAYLSLTINPYDWKSLDQICGRGILDLFDPQKYHAVKNCKEQHISIYDAVKTQMEWVKPSAQASIRAFYDIIREISNATPVEAIAILLKRGYGQYLEARNFDTGKLDILQFLAKYESTIPSFLQRLKMLEAQIQQGFEAKSGNLITLSTIHSSKGLEYDTVYMVDVYDGRFPSSLPNIFCRSKDSANGEQEERRLFYVGITRAKNSLHLLEIEGRPSSYIDELFPARRAARLQKEAEERRKREEEAAREQAEARRKLEEMFRQRAEEQRRIEEQRQKMEQAAEARRTAELAKQAAEQALKQEENAIRQEMQHADYDQNDHIIYDRKGRRWIKCKFCRKAVLFNSTELHSYVSITENKGTCYNCRFKR